MCPTCSVFFFQTRSWRQEKGREQRPRLLCSDLPRKHKPLSTRSITLRLTTWDPVICRPIAICDPWKNMHLCPLETSLPLVCLKNAPVSYTSLMVWYDSWILRVWCLKVVSIALTWSIRHVSQLKRINMPSRGNKDMASTNCKAKQGTGLVLSLENRRKKCAHWKLVLMHFLYES